MKNKSTAYLELVKKFKTEFDFMFENNEILHPFKINARFKDQTVINPWELWYGNLDAEILVIGQDFSDEKYFIDNLNSNWQKEIDLPKNQIVNKS